MDWTPLNTPEEILKIIQGEIDFSIPKDAKILKFKNQPYLFTTINGKTIPLHRAVWQEKFGLIPKGKDIHHKNQNKLDNRIENLECLTRKEHKAKHKKVIGTSISIN